MRAVAPFWNVVLRLSRYFSALRAIGWSFCAPDRDAVCAAMPAGAAPSATAPLRTTLTVQPRVRLCQGLVFSAGEYIDATTKSLGPCADHQPSAADRCFGRSGAGAGARLYSAPRGAPRGKAVRMAVSPRRDRQHDGPPAKSCSSIAADSWTGAPRACPRTSSASSPAAPAKPSNNCSASRQLTPGEICAPIRVHVASQPTFTRYVFDVPARSRFRRSFQG